MVVLVIVSWWLCHDVAVQRTHDTGGEVVVIGVWVGGGDGGGDDFVMMIV